LNDLGAEDGQHVEKLVLRHADAAYNLARWLLRRREDAEAVTQEALVRAYRLFQGIHSEDVRAWLL
jgi:RNA polymerase sigma-70 factor, ECF subfamily